MFSSSESVNSPDDQGLTSVKTADTSVWAGAASEEAWALSKLAKPVIDAAKEYPLVATGVGLAAAAALSMGAMKVVSALGRRSWLSANESPFFSEFVSA